MKKICMCKKWNFAKRDAYVQKSKTVDANWPTNNVPKQKSFKKGDTNITLLSLSNLLEYDDSNPTSMEKIHKDDITWIPSIYLNGVSDSSDCNKGCRIHEHVFKSAKQSSREHKKNDHIDIEIKINVLNREQNGTISLSHRVDLDEIDNGTLPSLEVAPPG